MRKYASEPCSTLSEVTSRERSLARLVILIHPEDPRASRTVMIDSPILFAVRVQTVSVLIFARVTAITDGLLLVTLYPPFPSVIVNIADSPIYGVVLLTTPYTCLSGDLTVYVS